VTFCIDKTLDVAYNSEIYLGISLLSPMYVTACFEKNKNK